MHHAPFWSERKNNHDGVRHTEEQMRQNVFYHMLTVPLSS